MKLLKQSWTRQNPRAWQKLGNIGQEESTALLGQDPFREHGTFQSEELDEIQETPEYTIPTGPVLYPSSEELHVYHFDNSRDHGHDLQHASGIRCVRIHTSTKNESLPSFISESSSDGDCASDLDSLDEFFEQAASLIETVPPPSELLEPQPLPLRSMATQSLSPKSKAEPEMAPAATPAPPRLIPILKASRQLSNKATITADSNSISCSEVSEVGKSIMLRHVISVESIPHQHQPPIAHQNSPTKIPQDEKSPAVVSTRPIPSITSRASRRKDSKSKDTHKESSKAHALVERKVRPDVKQPKVQLQPPVAVIAPPSPSKRASPEHVKRSVLKADKPTKEISSNATISNTGSALARETSQRSIRKFWKRRKGKDKSKKGKHTKQIDTDDIIKIVVPTERKKSVAVGPSSLKKNRRRRSASVKQRGPHRGWGVQQSTTPSQQPMPLKVRFADKMHMSSNASCASGSTASNTTGHGTLDGEPPRPRYSRVERSNYSFIEDEFSLLTEDVIAVVSDVLVPANWYGCTCGLDSDSIDEADKF